MSNENGRQKIVWGRKETEGGGKISEAEKSGGGGGRDGALGSSGDAGGGGYRGRRYRGSRHIFHTGMDLFTTEEVKKREKRAERFATDLALEYKPVAPSEDEEKKKQRAQRFGTEYKEPNLERKSGLMEVDLLEKRKEAQASSSSRLDTIHVYGVDLLSTKDILKYFEEYLPQYVEWINDSSCNVVFSDNSTAKRVLAGLGKPLTESVDSVDDLFKSMGKTWHKGQDFMKNGVTPVPLMFRLATDEDVKPRGGTNSRGLWLSGSYQKRYARKRRNRDVEMEDAYDQRGSKQSRVDLRQRLSTRNTEQTETKYHAPVTGTSAQDDSRREVVSYGDI